MPRLAPLLAHVDPDVKALIVQLAKERGCSQGTVVRSILSDWAKDSLTGTHRRVKPAAPPDDAPTFIRHDRPARVPVRREQLEPLR